MLVQNTSHPVITAADKVVEVLKQIGIPVTVEDVSPVQKRLHIEIFDDATFDDVLALGAFIGSVESKVLCSSNAIWFRKQFLNHFPML